MKGKSIFLILLGVLVALELISAALAFETLGEVFRTAYLAAIVLNVVFVFLAFRHLRTATVGVVVLALLIVPYQFWLGYRAWQLQNEAAAVVAHVYEQRLATNEYPATLDGYTFDNASLASHFQYQANGQNNCAFRVDYYVGTPNTSHSYCPSFGWSYYPD